ncbi:MAG: hypothetical protein IPJ06_15400 [Saprospiraceae bacterium]|nr:hypothetical protein [Saprospiraceae bacterium]
MEEIDRSGTTLVVEHTEAQFIFLLSLVARRRHAWYVPDGRVGQLELVKRSVDIVLLPSFQSSSLNTIFSLLRCCMEVGDIAGQAGGDAVGAGAGIPGAVVNHLAE